MVYAYRREKVHAGFKLMWGRIIMIVSAIIRSAFRAALVTLLITGGGSALAIEYEIIDLCAGYAPAINEQGHALCVADGITYYYDGASAVSLGTLGSGNVSGSDLNSKGEVVGTYRPAYSQYDTSVAFYDGQQWSLLGKFGSEFAWGSGINDSGTITGTYKPSGSGNRAFLFDVATGSFHDLPSYSDSLAINANGWIAGTRRQDDYSALRAYLYDGQNVTEILPIGGFLGGKVSYGYGINDQGHVVGHSQDEGHDHHAFVYDGISVRDLGTLGGKTSMANAINAHGVAVGNSLDASGQEVAFVHDGTVMHNLNELIRNNVDWVITDARDINDNGMIVGAGSYGGVQHGILLIPVPDLRLSANAPASVNESEPFEAAFSVTNDASTLTSDVSLSISIPDEIEVVGADAADGSCELNLSNIVCTFSEFPSGVSAPVSLSLGATVPGDFTLTATVSAKVDDSTPENNAASVLVHVNGIPRLSVESPDDGQVVPEGLPIRLTGTASDAEDGVLSESINWLSNVDGQLGTGREVSVTLSRGPHTITATVTDLAGATSDITRNLVVNGTPSLAVQSPTDGLMLNEGEQLTLRATALDPEDGDLGAQVQWTSSIDGPIGTGSEVSASLSRGTHLITAEAKDSAGATERVEVSGVLVNGLPALAVLSPEAGTVFSEGTSVLLSATASDPEDGEISGDIQWSSDADGQLGTGGEVSVILSPGAHTITASVTDMAGATSDVTRDLVVNGTPSLAVQSPTDGLILKEGEQLTLRATAFDPEDGDLGAQVQWTSSMDGPIGTGSEVSASLSRGTHLIIAEVKDSAGATERVEVAGVLVNGLPTLTVLSPEAGAVFSEGTSVLLSATASDPEDGEISGAIQWSSNVDGPLGSGATWSVTLSAGVHRISATVTDSAGVTVSASRDGIVSNAVPTVEVHSPATGTLLTEDLAVTFSATAFDKEDGDLSNEIIWMSDAVGILGSGAEITVNLAAGTHQVTAEVTDRNGNTTNARIEVVVDAVPEILLQVTSTGKGAFQTADLSWTGSRTPVDIYMDGVIVESGTTAGEASIQYKKQAVFMVCETQSHYCSDGVAVK